MSLRENDYGRNREIIKVGYDIVILNRQDGDYQCKHHLTSSDSTNL